MAVKKKKKRNYRKEYDNYQCKPEQRRRNDARKQSRRNMVKVHGKCKLKGKDIDHKDRNPLNKCKSNLRISSVKANRSRNGRRKKV
tara:strand:- start:1697 stop:1954 length:258 start_codon:yes stop_codon:yes gene_type:complete